VDVARVRSKLVVLERDVTSRSSDLRALENRLSTMLGLLGDELARIVAIVNQIRVVVTQLEDGYGHD
jgi:hypothetical protein